jgi:lipopolysaccharide/colanic/teichoic acid biosynthesis glycosyltransferase
MSLLDARLADREDAGTRTARGLDAIPLMTAAERRYERAKRVLDVTVALTSLLLLSPVLIVMALAIKLTSKGPVLYRATVHGRYGIPFIWHKFRTMVANGDDTAHRKFIESYVSESRQSGDTGSPAGGLYKLTPDPRVTRVGAILRKTSLDEMAQMLDVVRGRMSIVGPRPPVPYEYQLYTEEDMDRLSVLPGITGLAQVRARSKCSFAEMVALDREYIANRSIWLDLKIMLETVVVVFLRKGAY